jgi:hypothetical protein
MRKQSFLITMNLVLLTLAAFLSLAPSTQAAPQGPQSTPPLPHQISGLVRVNGAFVSPGTVVSAWCGGVQFDQFAAYRYENQSWYVLEVPGDDPATPEIEGCLVGEPISFMIGSLETDQTITWREGGIDQLDLSASGEIGTQVYLPLIIR